MKKKKDYIIEIRDLQTAFQVNELRKKIDRYYFGIMPIQMFQSFVRCITDNDIKLFFIRTFRHEHKNQSNKNLLKTKKIKEKGQNDTKVSINHHHSNRDRVFIVKPQDFSYYPNSVGPYLIFQCYKSISKFHGDPAWFNQSFLQSIDYTFKIIVNSRKRFSFESNIEKKIFEDILRSKYKEYVIAKSLQDNERINNNHRKRIEKINRLIEYQLNGTIRSYISSFHSICLKLAVDRFAYNESQQYYSYTFDF